MRNTLGVVTALVAFGLAASAMPAAALHLNDRHHVRAPLHDIRRDEERRHQHFLTPFGFGFGLPYWGDYGRYDSSRFWSGYAYDWSRYGYFGTSKWDYRNHSLPIERGSYVGGQPSAEITPLTPQEGSEHDRLWIRRCEPRLAFERDGVEHYYYNGKPGCSSGQWAD